MTTEQIKAKTERLEVEGPEGIAIRELWLEDAPRYFELVDSNREFLSQTHNGERNSTADTYKTVEDVIDTVLAPKNPAKKRFGIWVNDTMVGTNNLTPLPESGHVESGSWVAEQYSGHHYAAKARELLVKMAFEQLRYTTIVSKIRIGNETSRKSVEKSGFQYTGKDDDYWIYEFHNQINDEN